MNFQNKKFYLIGSAVILSGLFFLINTSSAWAGLPAEALAKVGGCSNNEAGLSFSKFLNPVASLAEKVVKDFGYDVVLAAAPDPDFCGSDSVGCSGGVPTVTISWEAAPSNVPCPNPTLCFSSGDIYLCYYQLTVSGLGIFTPINTTNYTISSGLANNTTYDWLVEAIYSSWCSQSTNLYPSATFGFTNQPSGSFTTLNCAPTCPAGSVSLNPSSINVGQTSTASAPSGWSSGSFSSSNNSIATVSGSTITGQSQGSAVISGSGWTAANGATSCTLNGATLTVNPTSKAHIVLSPTSFSFSGVSGGATPAGQTLNISNTGNATLNWTGSTDQGWCHLSSGSGSAAAGGGSQNVTVSVDAPTNVGSFNCVITISDANADNSPQTASVVYTVSSTPKAHIVLSPTSFSFSGVSGGATPAGQTLNISNTGNATLNWTGSTDQGWCHLSSGSGSAAAGGGSQNVTVSVDAPTNVGSFNCVITISDANADNSPQTASVVYNVSSASCPAGSVTLNPSSINVGQTSTASAPSGWSSGSFSSSNNSIATVSGSTITGQSQGSAVISGSGWTAANGATSCTLNGATLTVSSGPVPKYKCSGTSCVRDDANGTYTTSNCDNACIAVSACHCSRCSTIYDRQWVEFDTTDTTCATLVPSSNPVTRSLNCTCRAGDASWYNANYPGVCR